MVLGAVKSNIGHTETAAGMAGLIKLVMALEHRHVPGNLHFSELNPELDLDGFDVVLPGPGGEQLPGSSSGRFIGGVSSFGFGGTNAHAIVECPQ